MDEVDFQILVALHSDARQSLRSLGRQVGLTAPAVRDRLRRLESRGILQGYWASIPASVLGHDEVLVFFKGPFDRETATRALASPHAAWVAWKLDGGLTVQAWSRPGEDPKRDLARQVGEKVAGSATVEASPIAPPSLLSWRVLAELVQDPRIAIGRLCEATGLSPKTVRRHLDLLRESGVVTLLPRLGAFQDFGDVVFHVAVVGRAPIAKVRSALGGAWLVHETREPALRYFLSHAGSLGQAMMRIRATEALPGVESVTPTLTREILVNDPMVLRLIASATRT